ncbi:MAG: T9SS type A sorting domain-containing protein [Candidatus Eisenbacteria bacterium]|nr:T9SS type A sorting domain-containing protein [Candidatus Eisenbacteria bacterium]
MKRAHAILASLLATALAVGSVFAEGFGTPTLDGVVDAVYGSPEASDPAGDHWNNLKAMDMLNLYVCNDNNFWYFLFTVNENLSTTNWGKYLLYIDVTNDANGATSDAWARKTKAADPHKIEYSLNTWVNAAPYGPEDTQFWVWNQGTASWSMSGGADGAALSAGAVSGIEYKLARSRIGDPSTIWVEVWSTGEVGNPPAQDTSNDPADDWNAANWDDTATVLVSTMVTRQSGGDTTPPRLEDAYIIESNRDTLIAVFSEPLDPTSAQTPANYTVTGVTVNGAKLHGDSSQVLLTLSADMGLGSCLTLEAVNVKDRALNTIVDNNTTNVHKFYLTQLLVRANMNVYLRTNSAAPDPDTVAIEGSISPLTWDPTCDDLLADPEGDSIYVGRFVFMHTCTDGVTDTVTLEYKFTHQCATWESIGNHVYTLDGTYAIDTLDIWWDNLAPVDFTDKNIDVVFFVKHWNIQWDSDVDSIGVNGSQAPLNWDVPPANRLKDDGVLPDSTADDGVFSTRLTFPTGTLKNVDFKFLWKQLPDTLFNYECFEQSNRNVYLNDTLFSTTNPIVMDVFVWDYCSIVQGIGGGYVPAAGKAELLANVPNPFNPNTAIEFTLPADAFVDLSVYDVSGRLVRGLLLGELAAGSYVGDRAVPWDGTDDSGAAVRSGVYFYRLKADGREMTRKMVLVR